MHLPEVCRILSSNVKLYQMQSEKSMYSTCHRIHCLVTIIKLPSNHSNNLMIILVSLEIKIAVVSLSRLLSSGICSSFKYSEDFAKYDILEIVYKNQLSIAQNRHFFLTHNYIYLDDSFPKRNPSALLL